MDITLLIYGLVPILVFAAADMAGNPRSGYILAVVLAGLETIWMYHKFGSLDPVSVIALVTIVVLGAATLRSKNAVFYKLQPTLVAATAMAFLAYTQFVGPSIMERYGDGMRALMTGEQLDLLNEPRMIAYLDRLFTAMIAVFFLHGVWMTYLAYKSTTAKWILVRALGLWAIAVPMIFAVGIFAPP